MNNTHLDRDAFDGIGLERFKVDLARDGVALVDYGEGSRCRRTAVHCECQPFGTLRILQR